MSSTTRPPAPLQIQSSFSTTSGSSPSLRSTSPTPPPFPPAPTPLPGSVPDPTIESKYPDFDDAQARANPRKYAGYRLFSRFLASDRSFLMVRRFGTLNARVLLAMQDEIAELEESLDFMDRTYSRVGMDDNVDNGSFRNDPFPGRQELITKILPEKLARYNDFVTSYAGILERGPSREQDIANVTKWLAPIKPEGLSKQDFSKKELAYFGPIEDLEAAYIKNTDDLFSISPKSRSWFRNVLEGTFILRIPGIRDLFERHPEGYNEINRSVNPHTIWPNDNRVEGLSSGMIAVIGLGMLVSPLWILHKFGNPTAQLSIITGFIILFFILIALATTAKVFDALAAAAAYSAVLMVFLQLGNPGGV